MSGWYVSQLLMEWMPMMTYCFIMAVTPGPNNVMLATTGANFGYRGAFPLILGIQFGLIVQTLALCAGLASLFAAYPVLHTLLRYVGTGYLIFLAWKLSRAAGLPEGAGQAISFREAVLFQAFNPKSWIRSLTLASVFMPVHLGLWQAALATALLGSVVGASCNLIWASFGVAIRGILRQAHYRKLFNLVMGATLFVLAVTLLFSKV